jgi:hypothetical protein
MDRTEALAMMARVEAEIVAVRPRVDGSVFSMPDHLVFWLFSRIHSTFLGVKLLIEGGLIDEAMQLDRSLMTDALRLMKLDGVGDDRVLYVLGLVNDGITERENLIGSAARMGLESDPNAALATLAEERKKVQRYQARHRLGQLRKLPHEKQLAEEFGLSVEYWDFEYVNNLVHGSASIASRRISRKDDTYYFASRDESDTWVGPAAGLASQWALRAVRSFRSMFVPDPTALARVDRMIEEVESAMPGDPGAMNAG